MLYYVYSISINNVVFYIGMTGEPIRRFRQHFIEKQSRVSKVARYCLFNNNTVINMKLLYACRNRAIAERLERRYIDVYNVGYCLTNDNNIWDYVCDHLPDINIRFLNYFFEDYEPIILQQQIKLTRKYADRNIK